MSVTIIVLVAAIICGYVNYEKCWFSFIAYLKTQTKENELQPSYIYKYYACGVLISGLVQFCNIHFITTLRLLGCKSNYQKIHVIIT